MIDYIDKVIQGNCVEVLPEIPENSIDLVITSPPYYSKRNYGITSVWDGDPTCEHEFLSDGAEHDNLRFRAGEHTSVGNNLNPEIFNQDIHDPAFCVKCGAWKGQLGLEPTHELYIQHLADIFDLVKPALANTGSLWVNLSDSYAGSGQKARNKTLLGIPAMFQTAMINRGWICRNVVIWEKTNPMPESVNDRFTNNFEYFFFFVKSNNTKFWINERTKEIVSKQPKGIHGIQYYDYVIDEDNEKRTLWHGYDYYFVKQLKPQKPISATRALRKDNADNHKKDGVNDYALPSKNQARYHAKVREILAEGKPLMRNERSTWHTEYIMYAQKVYDAFIEAGVNGKTLTKANELLSEKLDSDLGSLWDIATKSFHGKHFATYPIELLDNIIKSCCPQKICNTCGLPQVKFYPSNWEQKEQSPKVAALDNPESPMYRSGHHNDGLPHRSSYTKSETARCNCVDNDFKPGIMLDPFAGVSTTGLGAVKYKRHYTMIELNPDYVEESQSRIKHWKCVYTPDMFE